MSAIDTVLSENRSAFYTLDVSVLKARVRALRSRMPSRVSLCYAAKANPFVVKELADTIGAFELCSPGEYAICKTLGIDSKTMVISGVYKTPEFIESLIADDAFCGAYTVESVLQYRLLSDLSRKYDKPIRVLIRLTNSSQFGVNESDVEEILDEAEKLPSIHIAGIQFFSGTQKTSVKKIRREIEYLDAFLLRLRDERGFRTELLEYGPGFPVAYFENEDFDEDAYLAEFAEIVNGMTYQTKITLELGRSIVASCGRYYTHVVDTKCNKGIRYAVVDGGMHHIVYFGQQMAMKHPKLSVIGKPIVGENLWTICGSLCSMNDIIVKQMPLPDLEVGDVLCFENAGAYCMMEGISLFLSRDLPAVYLLPENGEAIRIREAFETSRLNTPDYKRFS